MIDYVLLALLFSASTYGYGEKFCGEEIALPCTEGAVTASGEVFDPEDITAAVPLPREWRIRIQYVHLKGKNGACVKVKINDKKNARYVGNGGLDLTPAALVALGHTPSPTWSGKVELCKEITL